MQRFRTTLVLLLSLAACTPAIAADYRIEMVIFQRFDNAQGESWPGNAGDGPDMTLAVSPLPGVELSSGNGRLGPSAYTLGRQGYRVLLHAAWIQPVGGRSSKRWYSVRGRNLHGLVRVTRGRYLHFETDLVVDTGAEGPVRTNQSRRMRSDEVHYIDHPRLGILVRIDPYTAPGSAGAATAAPTEASPTEDTEPGAGQ